MNKLAAIGSIAFALVVSVGCSVSTEEDEDTASSADALDSKTFTCQYRPPGCDSPACASVGNAVYMACSGNGSGIGCKVGNVTYCQRIYWHGAVPSSSDPRIDSPPPSVAPSLTVTIPTKELPKKGGTGGNINPCFYGICP